jgi:hypothetical protein
MLVDRARPSTRWDCIPPTALQCKSQVRRDALPLGSEREGIHKQPGFARISSGTFRGSDLSKTLHNLWLRLAQLSYATTNGVSLCDEALRCRSSARYFV